MVKAGVCIDVVKRVNNVIFFFFFKQKTAYEIVSRDWSSDVCSSDLTVSQLRCGSLLYHINIIFLVTNIDFDKL